MLVGAFFGDIRHRLGKQTTDARLTFLLTPFYFTFFYCGYLWVIYENLYCLLLCSSVVLFADIPEIFSDMTGLILTPIHDDGV